MLKDFDWNQAPHAYVDHKTSELGETLDKLQRQAQMLNIPVLIFIDGWESSGKGQILKDLTRELDPRYVRVEAFERLSDEEKAHPATWRYWNRIPSRQEIAVFDRSFYYTVMNDIDASPKDLKHQVKDIMAFEQSLIEDNYLIIKFFLNVTQNEQQKRIEALENTAKANFLLSETDYHQNKKYKKYRKHFDHILAETHHEVSPWHIINADDLKLAAKEVLGITIDQLTHWLGQNKKDDMHKTEETPVISPSIEKVNLTQLDLNQKLSVDEYDAMKEDLQKQAAGLLYQAYQQDIPIILAFEGVDAAGKGGAIQRLTRMMDPRTYKIFGIKAPTQEELDHHYLWRFQKKFPRKGMMTIFDRSWYGRVLVERIEGFATQEEWQRAYQEMNTMEEIQVDHGAMVLKFFLFIDQDEQARRFKDRQENPDKNYKITDEDWRNRDKWSQYIEAFQDMLTLTDTKKAPWEIIASNDKYWARIEVLKRFNQHLEAHLAKRKDDK